MIPFSTAVFDPPWYHAFKHMHYNFLDKNGVLNGLRIKDLAPGRNCEGLCTGTSDCVTLNPKTCAFLQEYQKQLEGVPYDALLEYLQKVTSKIQERMGFEEEPIAVLIVYEPPTKECSERTVLHRVYGIQELQYPISDNY